MTFTAIAVLAIWALAMVDLASDGSWWTRTVREAKRRAKAWTE